VIKNEFLEVPNIDFRPNTEHCFLNILSLTGRKDFVTIPLPKPNQSASDNMVFQTARRFQPLFIKFPLVAHSLLKRALMPLSMGYYRVIIKKIF
jgi:hypothetical protein